MATGKFNLTIRDRDDEASSVGVHVPVFNVGNIVAQSGLIDDLKDAILAVVLGVEDKDQRTLSETLNAYAVNAAPFNQRGIKWLVRMRDSVTGLSVSFHIPTANLGLAGILTGENMDLTSVEGAALKAAIEAVVVSAAGNAVEVIEVVYID